MVINICFLRIKKATVESVADVSKKLVYRVKYIHGKNLFL